MQKALSLRGFPLPVQISLCAVGYLWASSDISQAQVTTDGKVNTEVNQIDNVAEITGGETRGNNLFHSFQDFSVPTGNEAFFDNANNISNIFSRVTGGNISNIDGAIRANGSASLFLINPAGIIFGENASLNIGGSFYGSSASSILFEDGEFSAADLENPPLLTVNAPIGLGFRDNPGDIVNQASTGNGLEVLEGQNISLIGGNVRLQEGGRIFTPGGTIELGGLTTPGEIDIAEDNSFSFPDDVIRGDVSLSNNASLITFSFAMPNGGDINLIANSVSVNDNSILITSQLEQFRGGNVNIDATNNVSFSNNSNIAVPAQEEGSIFVNAKNLTITSGSGFSAGITPNANSLELEAGNIIINVAEDVVIDGLDNPGADGITGVFSQDLGGIGNSGTITINAANEILVDGTSTLTIGEETQEIVSGISANSFNVDTEDFFSTAVGNAGTIEINTPRFSVSNGAEITAFIRGEGNAGSIIINTDDFVRVSGTSFIATGVQEGTGTGGNLEINTKQLSVLDGSTILVSTFADGDAGSLTINASESIELTGTSEFSRSGLFASALDGAGNGGNINVFTNELNISDDAVIGASNFSSFGTFDQEIAGTGQPGNINIEANTINLNTEGRIEAVTQSEIGLGANIDLQVAEDITLQGNSFISARAINQGNGGNLSINSRFITAFPGNGNGNDIIAIAEQGQGGNITINAESLFGISEGVAIAGNGTNDIDASSEFDLDGSVTIDTPDINRIQGTRELPNNIVVPEQTTTQACQANRELAAQNGLTIKGKGGVPPAPELALNSQNIYINGESSNPTSAIPQAIETSQGKIQPARGIQVKQDGGIVLTAYRTNNSGERIPSSGINCDRY